MRLICIVMVCIKMYSFSVSGVKVFFSPSPPDQLISHRACTYTAPTLAAPTQTLHYTVASDSESEAKYVVAKVAGFDPYTYLCRPATWPRDAMPGLRPIT